MKSSFGKRADRWRKEADRIMEPWTEKVSACYRLTYVESAEETERRSRHCLRRIGAWITVTLMILVLTAAVLFVCARLNKDMIRLRRNDFGEGEREETLILTGSDHKTKGKRTYRLLLKERELSQNELEEMFKVLFQKLETVMAGDNRSLHSVSRDLCFPQNLSGYPFTLSYRVRDVDYISADGRLSEMSGKIGPGEKKKSRVTVTALYVSGNHSFMKSHTYQVLLTSPGSADKKSPEDGVIRKLQRIEEQNRGSKEVEIPGRMNGFTIRQTDRGIWKPLLLLTLLLTAVPVHRLGKIREDRKRCQKEAVRDFAMIVHLFTIYQRAGLSFTNTLARINKDYRERIKRKGSRYAFERLIQMQECIDRGMPASRACRVWGSQFDDPCFRKLSGVLIQSMEKGSSETGIMMEEEEREAFRQRIDQARKDGEEASTKMLLPMVLMLAQVMLLAIYPALLRFYSF